MPATVQELLEYTLVNISGLSEGKARTVSARFDEVSVFLKEPKSGFKNLQYEGGRKLNFSEEELGRIRQLQKSDILNPKASPSQNFIAILGIDFLERQIRNIRSLRLESLNANPLLIASLKLNTPKDIVRYFVYQAASRSIVTSMGYLVQDLLIHSGSDVYDGKDYPGANGAKWDLVKKDVKGVIAWLEIKSGPNDLDKGQILSYKKMIEEVERRNGKGFIGETYGKRNSKTMTHGLYEQYLEDWDTRTLIGKELWEFVSGDKDYPNKLVNLLRMSADKVLNSKTILQEMDACVDRVLKEFIVTYGGSKDSVSLYLNSLW